MSHMIRESFMAPETANAKCAYKHCRCQNSAAFMAAGICEQHYLQLQRQRSERIHAGDTGSLIGMLFILIFCGCGLAMLRDGVESDQTPLRLITLAVLLTLYLFCKRYDVKRQKIASEEFDTAHPEYSLVTRLLESQRVSE